MPTFKPLEHDFSLMGYSASKSPRIYLFKLFIKCISLLQFCLQFCFVFGFGIAHVWMCSSLCIPGVKTISIQGTKQEEAKELTE